MLLSPGHSPLHLSSPSPSTPQTPATATATPSRKRGPAVLDEDAYLASIERIIERDFFPDIPKLRDRLDWLEALRSRDPVLIRDAQLKIRDRRASAAAAASSSIRSTTRTPASSAFFPDPSATPAASDTANLSHPPADLTDASVNTSLSLDDFLFRYTSEDNDSFSKILDKVNRKRRDRVSHLLEGETNATAIEDGNELDRITDGYGTSGQPVSTLDGWKYRAKNLLMYIPDKEVALTVEERGQRAIAATKEIARGNTRFHGKGSEETTPAKEEERVIYGVVPGLTPVGAAWPFADREAERARKYDLEDLRRTPNPFFVESGKKAENGYSFVKTPSPAPGVDKSPFMTWGEIEGTPMRLDLEEVPFDLSGSSGGPQFKIQQVPSRDVKAHTLSRDAAKKLRERSNLFKKPPLPSPARRGSASPNVRILSPAAHKFFRNAIAKSSRSTVDETLRASYRGASPITSTPKESTATPKERTGMMRFSRDWSLGSRSPSTRQDSTPGCSYFICKVVGRGGQRREGR